MESSVKNALNDPLSAATAMKESGTKKSSLNRTIHEVQTDEGSKKDINRLAKNTRVRDKVLRSVGNDDKMPSARQIRAAKKNARKTMELGMTETDPDKVRKAILINPSRKVKIVSIDLDDLENDLRFRLGDKNGELVQYGHYSVIYSSIKSKNRLVKQIAGRDCSSMIIASSLRDLQEADLKEISPLIKK